MRAMPSPIEMMLPTSATSTSTAKLPICSRMILEISSALMSMRCASVGARARGSRLGDVQPWAPRVQALHRFELFLHSFQLPHDTRVVDGAADARHQSADDCRIDLGRHR